MSIYENDLHLLSLWFMSIMLLLCFTLTIVICCDSPKRKQQELTYSTTEDASMKKNVPKKAAKEVPEVKKEKTPEPPVVQPTGKQIDVEKAKPPTEFADVRDYSTLRGHENMKLSIMKKKEESMGYNIVNQSVLKKVEEIAAKGAKQTTGETKATATGIGKVPQKTGGTMVQTSLLPKKLHKQKPGPSNVVPETSLNLRVIDEDDRIQVKEVEGPDDRKLPRTSTSEETPRKSRPSDEDTPKSYTAVSEGKERKIPDIPKVTYMEKKASTIPFGTLVEPPSLVRKHQDDKRDRERDRSRDRSFEKPKDHHERDRDRSRGRDRDKDRNREKDRDHGRDRSRGRDHDRDRDKGRDRGHDRDRDRERSRGRDRSRGREPAGHQRTQIHPTHHHQPRGHHHAK